jgi:hypothetical protein
MSAMHSHHRASDKCPTDESRQQERIACALEGLVDEVRRTQGILATIARHLIGGLSPEELEAAKAEARKLALDLQSSRRELSASVKAQSQPTDETKT